MKLVVCDDDPVIRYLLEVVLAKRGGHDVTSIEDGSEVAAAVAANAPVDLVLLDFMMPGLSGLDVASELAADPSTAKVPVVFLTGRADIADETFDDLNVVGVIEKPFDTSTLAARLQELIG